MRGKSWLPYFEQGMLSGQDETEAVHAVTDEPVGWESEYSSLVQHDWFDLEQCMDEPLSAMVDGRP